MIEFLQAADSHNRLYNPAAITMMPGKSCTAFLKRNTIVHLFDHNIGFMKVDT